MKKFIAALAAFIVRVNDRRVRTGAAGKGRRRRDRPVRTRRRMAAELVRRGLPDRIDRGHLGGSPDRVLIFARGCLPVSKTQGSWSRRATRPATTCRRRIRRAIRDGITSSTSSIATAS